MLVSATDARLRGPSTVVGGTPLATWPIPECRPLEVVAFAICLLHSFFRSDNATLSPSVDGCRSAATGLPSAPGHERAYECGTTSCSLLLRPTAAAQQIGQNAPASAKETATIRVSTQLVVEAVVVKDKKGNPIRGLTAKDFTITENGAPQTISFCEHQELPKAASAPLQLRAAARKHHHLR